MYIPHLPFFSGNPASELEPLPFFQDWDKIPRMTDQDEMNESSANILCKACGLCCTGYLFIWAKLRPAELDPAEALGMHVFRSDPTQRGFSQPCPLWQGKCTIYASPHYPHSCRAYTCNLLDDVLSENTSLPNALAVVEQAKGIIQEVEALLPASSHINFRERLVAHLESVDTSAEESAGQAHTNLEFRLKAEALLLFYKNVFGVKDLLDKPDEMEW